MKMKEFGPPGGAHVPGVPLPWICQLAVLWFNHIARDQEFDQVVNS